MTNYNNFSCLTSVIIIQQKHSVVANSIALYIIWVSLLSQIYVSLYNKHQFELHVSRRMCRVLADYLDLCSY